MLKWSSLPASRELWPHWKIGLHMNSGHVRLCSDKISNFKFLQLPERGKNELLCLQFKRSLIKARFGDSNFFF